MTRTICSSFPAAPSPRRLVHTLAASLLGVLLALPSLALADETDEPAKPKRNKPAAEAGPVITIDTLRETEAKIRDLAERVMPATVSLIPGGNSPRFGTGSGVVVSEDGLVLTAAHVAVEMNEQVTVIFPNGDRAEAKVLGMDFSRDAAMIQILDGEGFPFVEIGDSDAMKRNEWCIALGHAGGYDVDRPPPVRLGRVIDNDPEKFLNSDSALIGGDSGGPLFDVDGKLIGIHSNIGFSLSQNRHVPISVFVTDWERLKRGDRYGGSHVGGLLANPDRPVMGAMLEDAKDNGGAFVRGVVPNSPAAKAGLDSGDTIVNVQGAEITDSASLMAEIEKRKVGDTLRMTVENGEQQRGVAVKLVAARELQGQGPGRMRGSDQASPSPNGNREPESSEEKPEPGSEPKSKNDGEVGNGRAGEDKTEKSDEGDAGAGPDNSDDARPAPENETREERQQRRREARARREREAMAEEQDKPEAGEDSKPAPAPAPKTEPGSGSKGKGKDKSKDKSGDQAAAEAEPESDSDDEEVSKEQKELQAAFDKRMRDAIKSGNIELTPEELEEFGGPEGFRDLLRDFQSRMTQDDMAEMMRALQRGAPKKPEDFDPDEPIEVGEKFFRDVLDAFRPLVAEASDSTHPVFRGSEWKAMCTVIRADGYAITKASEIEARNNQVLNVLLGKGRLVAAELVEVWENYDLALIKLDLDGGDGKGKVAETLPVVNWHREGEALPLGSMIAAAGPGPDPLAIGVISVQPRSLSGGNKGFLGIGSENHPKGVRVSRVLPNGNAGKAGVKVGDVITHINDEVCDTPEKLIRLISGTTPGETVTLQYLRGGKERNLDVTLGDREDLDSAAAAGERANRMNRFGTEISRRISGFLRIQQNDLPIQPEHCGAPVVDLEGRVIGINIARGGRIKTYMLLTEDVLGLIEPALAELPFGEPAKADDAAGEKAKGNAKAKAKAKPAEPAPAGAGE